MKHAKFIVEGDIVTKARPRASVINGHAIMYTPKTTMYYENWVKSCYKEQCDGLNFESLPIKVKMHFNFRANKEIQQLCDELGLQVDEIQCTNHKDCDNLAKIILDGLNGVAFVDDKNIVELKVAKHYSIEPYEFVSIMIDELHTTTVDDLKRYKRIGVIKERIQKLESKEKLNKTDSEKLEKYKIELDELEV